MNRKELVEQIFAKKSFLCVGLDTDIDKLPTCITESEEIQGAEASMIFKFNKAIIDAINAANPDLLWIGMTAPKQEKWTYSHWNELNIHCHVGTIGAVFDFFAGTVERAPIWWQDHGLEWLYRLMKEPKRMWRRYIIGNSLFLWNMTKE